MHLYTIVEMALSIFHFLAAVIPGTGRSWNFVTYAPGFPKNNADGAEGQYFSRLFYLML